MKKLFCLIGLHLHLYFKIKWIEHYEGMLGYWYCPTCFAAFNGFVHKLNKDGASAYRIKELNKTEVRKYVGRSG